MVSFRTTLLAVASAVVVSADYWVDPESVSMSDKLAWCQDQRTTCPIICLQTTTEKPRENECDAEYLTYSCVCSDGKKPNMTEYTLTLPYHTCTRWGTQCVAACGSDNECASKCREDHPCGAQSPTRVNTTSTTTTMASATKTASPTDEAYSGFGDDSDDGESDDSSDRNAAGALRFGDSYGLAVVAGGLFAGVALLL